MAKDVSEVRETKGKKKAVSMKRKKRVRVKKFSHRLDMCVSNEK